MSHMNASCHIYRWIILEVFPWCLQPTLTREQLLQGTFAAGIRYVTWLILFIYAYIYIVNHFSNENIFSRGYSRLEYGMWHDSYVYIYVCIYIYIQSIASHRRTPSPGDVCGWNTVCDTTHTYMHVYIYTYMHIYSQPHLRRERLLQGTLRLHTYIYSQPTSPREHLHKGRFAARIRCMI